jgi:hypothetical protein
MLRLDQSLRVPIKVMVFFAGIVRGLSGPGGVLGVLPAVQLRNPKLSALYLASFCISSALTMGCYATLYGLCSSRLSTAGIVYNTFDVLDMLSFKKKWSLCCTRQVLLLLSAQTTSL